MRRIGLMMAALAAFAASGCSDEGNDQPAPEAIAPDGTIAQDIMENQEAGGAVEAGRSATLNMSATTTGSDNSAVSANAAEIQNEQ